MNLDALWTGITGTFAENAAVTSATVTIVAPAAAKVIKAAVRWRTRRRRGVPGHFRRVGSTTHVRPYYRKAKSALIATTFVLRARPRALGISDRGHPARPGRSVSGLVGAAAFLLPVTDRARYAEEYRSELWDLAQSGAGRLRQLLYALRQLRRAIPMGLALRSPRRRSAAP
jgi:hypothetical protein